MSQAGANNTNGGGGGGGGVTSLAGNTGGPLTGALNLIGNVFSTGDTVTVVGGGTTLTLSFTDGNQNTALGQGAGGSSTGGAQNTSVGSFALNGGGVGNGNTCIGNDAGRHITTGSNNTLVGNLAMDASFFSGIYNCTLGAGTARGLIDGSYNILIGGFAGDSYNFSESSNICLNASTAVTIPGETNVLRIGNGTGTGPQQLDAAFIYGIFGKSVDVVTGTALFIDTNSKIGTTVSSARFKENINKMTSEFSSRIYDLKPATFNYISDKNKTPSFGLIAEEVEKVMPELVVRDKDGLPSAVKYHDLPTLLLNELIKLKKEVASLKAKVNKNGV